MGRVFAQPVPQALIDELWTLMLQREGKRGQARAAGSPRLHRRDKRANLFLTF
jgi:hypothetical protein